ncbi:MAG: helix-turn-helix domain-containing protein [Halanaerobiales bacterium]|nr:helix-turn-helix domain-containing protein [Halanaerobiales bacterium]
MKVNKNKLKKMNSLLETIKLLNSEQDVDTILNTLMTKSLELTPGGDMGAIFLLNKESGYLEIYASYEMGSAVKDVQLEPGESMTGLAFSKQQTIFFKDSDSVQQAMAQLSSRNKELAVKGDVIAEEIRGAICCPLINKNEVIGVLVVDNTSDEHSLCEEDVEFLNDISIQATIAIVNARNYKQQLQTNKQLQEYNQIIQEQKNKYKYSTDIHTKLTNMILSGSSIKDILKELKSMINKDIFIIDIFYNLRYHSFKKDQPKKNSRDNLHQLIPHLNNKKSEYIDHEDDLKYIIFPIIVKEEILGWFCVLSSVESHLNQLETITCERATTIIALELIKEDEIADMEQSLKGDFLDSLMLNNDCEFIKKSAERYGFDFENNHQIIAVDFCLNAEDEQQKKKIIKKYYQIINKESKKLFHNSISFIKRNMIIILTEDLGEESESKIEGFNQQLKEIFSSIFSFNQKKSSYKLAVSSSFSEIADFKNSYFNTINTLNMIEEQSEKNYAFYDQLEIKKLLAKNNTEELKDFADKILKPLKEYGGSSKNDLLKTLRIYLQSNCSWTSSKEELHIHGNTLSYRLNRIKEILNIDFDDYNDRLKLQLAFEIEEIV